MKDTSPSDIEGEPMRRKIISLHNIALGFRIFGFVIPVIGSLAGIWMLVNGVRFANWAGEQAKSQSSQGLGNQIERYLVLIYPGTSMILMSLLAGLTVFMLSELIHLFLRMEVDLKQIRFNMTESNGSPAATPSVEGSVAAVTLLAATPTPASDEAIEIELPAAPGESSPAKPALDLYAERDHEVPFDVLITPKGGSPAHAEEETADSSPDLPVFETHEEETPKIDTRPISYCPSCNAMIRYKPEKKGKVIKCPKCTQPFRLGVS